MYQYISKSFCVVCVSVLFVFICHLKCTKMYLYCTQKFVFSFLPDWYRCYFTDLCLENRSEMSTESCKAGDDFIVALLNVFSRMNSVPKALTLVLEPYLDQAHVWTHLHTLAGKFIKIRIRIFFFVFGPGAGELTFTDCIERKTISPLTLMFHHTVGGCFQSITQSTP